MDVRVGLWRRLSAKELMLRNCGVGEDSSESLGQQGDQPVHPKGNHSWIFIGRTHAEAWSSKPSDAITDSLEKTLMLGKTEGRRRRGWQRMKWLDAITDSMGMSLSKLWELVMGMEAWLCCSPRGLGHRVGHVWATELKWTNTTRKSSPEILVTLLMA